MNEENLVPLAPYSTTQLADFYNVDRKTFMLWLAPYWQYIGPRRGRFFTILQVEIIFKLLGRPLMPKEPRRRDMRR
jgi:hypothetical protein